jgi:centromeric protein E
MRIKLENERQALAAFVSKFDALGLGGLGLPPIPVSSTSVPFNPPKPTPGGANAIFAERQKNRLVLNPLESFKIAETNESGANPSVTESPLRVSTKTRMDTQPSLLEEEWEGVSMNAEDFEAETLVANVPSKEKRGSFLRTIGVDVKDVFGMGKENMPATVS